MGMWHMGVRNMGVRRCGGGCAPLTGRRRAGKPAGLAGGRVGRVSPSEWRHRQPTVPRERHGLATRTTHAADFFGHPSPPLSVFLFHPDSLATSVQPYHVHYYCFPVLGACLGQALFLLTCKVLWCPHVQPRQLRTPGSCDTVRLGCHRRCRLGERSPCRYEPTQIHKISSCIKIIAMVVVTTLPPLGGGHLLPTRPTFTR